MADEVGDRPTLALLDTLVEADSLATGPSAWGAWKAGLVADLVDRTGRSAGRGAGGSAAPWITEELRAMMDTVRTHGAPALSIDIR